MSEGKRAQSDMTLLPRVEIEAVRKVPLDSMIASVDVRILSCGLKIRGLGIHEQDGESWVEVPLSQVDNRPVLEMNDRLCRAVLEEFRRNLHLLSNTFAGEAA